MANPIQGMNPNVNFGPETARPGKRGSPSSKKPNDVISTVFRLFDESRAMRRKEEGKWYVDSKYLAGDQWVVWDPRHENLTVRAKKHWRIRQTINHIRPSIEIILNILTSRRPSMQVIPATTEPTDRQAAKACEKLLKYLWTEQDFDETLDEALTWMAVSSRGIVKVGWDPHAGPVVALPKYDDLPEGVIPGPGVEVPVEYVNVGEIVTSVVPTFNFHIDPAATSIEKARWCGDEYYMHVDEARARWPKKAKEISPDGGRSVWYNYARKLLFEKGDQMLSEDVTDTVTVREMYFAPSSKYRTGRKVTVAGKTLVEDVDSPYNGRFPYVDFLAYRNPGSYWGDSIVHLGRNAQTSFNRARSHFMEMMQKTGNPQWMVAKGAGVSRGALTDEPGSVIYYNPIGIKPVEQLVGTQPPPGWNQLMQMDLQDMRDQLGVVDVMRGENPPGVRAGRSLAYLIEQNLGRHGPLMRRFERSVQRLGRIWLQLAKQFYAEERMLAITGENGMVDVMMLSMSDLESSRDVVVISGSAMPESRAARQDFVMSLYQNGLLVDSDGMPDHKRALRLMEFSSGYDVYEDSNSSDRAWALEENERMAMGEPLMPELHDNHPMHGDVHVSFMRTSRYRRLPDEIKTAFRQHLDAHISTMGPPPGAEGAPPGGGPGAPAPAGVPDMRGGGAPAEPRTDLRGGPE